MHFSFINLSMAGSILPNCRREKARLFLNSLNAMIFNRSDWQADTEEEYLMENTEEEFLMGDTADTIKEIKTGSYCPFIWAGSHNSSARP